MGTLIGHVAPGMAFFLIGLWHLFNHIKVSAANPGSYRSRPWFPVGRSRFRYLELFLIMVGSCTSIAMELFIGPARHQPLDPDGTIPWNHLHNFEHASISASFLVYAAFAVSIDRVMPEEPGHGLTQVVASAAFAQQLFLFRTHSTDHSGVEGQYHLLLQILVAVSLSTAILGIFQPANYHVSFVRSASIIFQGAWLVLMGLALWTPRFVTEGCFIRSEEGHQVVRCRDDHHSLRRAKSLVNIQFSWSLIAVTVFSAFLHLAITKYYVSKTVKSYRAIYAQDTEMGVERRFGDDDSEEAASARKYDNFEETASFRHIGKSFAPIDIER